jgi:hypothetical protein
MRPYGVTIPECPDVREILMIGAKSSFGELPGLSGHFRGICRGAAKARTRRYWKRVARAEGKRAVHESVDNGT